MNCNRLASKKIAVLFALFATCVSLAAPVVRDDALACFSSLSFHPKEGETTGLSLVVLRYTGGVKVLWTEAEGKISAPKLLDAVMTSGTEVEFSAPLSGIRLTSAKLTIGTNSATLLLQDRPSVRLKRRCGYSADRQGKK